jgi:hypothetical protein
MNAFAEGPRVACEGDHRGWCARCMPAPVRGHGRSPVAGGVLAGCSWWRCSVAAVVLAGTAMIVLAFGQGRGKRRARPGARDVRAQWQATAGPG